MFAEKRARNAVNADDDGGGGDDEYEQYVRSKQPTQRKPVPRNDFADNEDEDMQPPSRPQARQRPAPRNDFADEDDMPMPPPRRPAQRKPTLREEFADDDEDSHPRQRPIAVRRPRPVRDIDTAGEFDNDDGADESVILQNGQRRSTKFARGKTIPFAIQQAARLLRDQFSASVKSVPLMAGRLDDGLEVIAGTTCDLAVVDPYVVLRASFQVTGITVFLKEVVHISYYLLARLLKLRFTVPFRNDVVFYDEAVQLRPYKGVVSSIEAQPFGCADEVESVLRDDDTYAELLPQFEGYMKSLGPLSPFDVCDEIWVEQTLDKFQQILDGTLVVIKPPPNKNRE